ncbi:MAG: acyl carrier protein [Nitrosotalea sp.]
MNNYEEKVKSIISKVIKVKKESIKLEDDLVKKYNMDSMQRVEVVIELEKEFDVSISDEVALTLCTVKIMLNFLEQTVNQK